MLLRLMPPLSANRGARASDFSMLFRSLAASAVAWVALSCSAGAISRDFITIGSQRFVRSNLRLVAIDLPDLHADQGIAALSYMRGNPDRLLTLAHFDQWLNTRHEPAIVDPVLGVRAINPFCARGGSVTAVLWRARDSSSLVWLRTFDVNGMPLSEPFRFVDAVANPIAWTVIASDDYVLGIVNGQVSGVNQPRLAHLRWFSPHGEVLTSPIPIVGDLGGYNTGFRAALNSDGTALVAYGNVYNGGFHERSMAQVAYFSGEFTPPLEVAPGDSGPLAGRWLTDGRAALCISDLSIGRSILQRRDATGLSLIQQQAYGDAQPRGAALSRRGLAAVTTLADPLSPQLQLFDVDWEPIGGPVDFRPPGIGGSVYFAEGGFQNVAIDDSGTVWIVWIAYNTPAAACYLTSFRPIRTGDMNLDGLLNNFDIDPFVMALVDLNAYEAQYGIPAGVGRILGDVNGDGALNNFDIDPFVACLVNGGCPQQQ